MSEGYAAISFGAPYVARTITSSLQFGTVAATFSNTLNGPAPGQHQIVLAVLKYKNIVPNSLLFSWNGKTFYDRNGVMYHTFDPASGSGIVAGTINYQSHIVSLTDWGGPTVPAALPVVQSMLLEDAMRTVAFVRFRTPGSPLRPGSMIVRATALDGTLITATSDTAGKLMGAHVSGHVDYQNGIVEVNFGEELLDSGTGPFPWRTDPWYSADARYQKLPALDYYVFRPKPVDPSTVLFNTVVFAAIPLDADLIGIDPVRLPSDGRVPIFKTGYVIVIHDTEYTTAPSGLISGQVINLPRGHLTYAYVRDQAGVLVPTDRYILDLDAGTVTMGNPINLAGFTQPLVIEDRIEDMLLCTDVDISGSLKVARALTHSYSAATALVSSALLFGDLQGRYTGLFDQTTWANVWSNTLIGSAASASYNDVDFPIDITNEGAITQRWALVFTNPTNFNVLGEDIGLIATGSTAVTLSPDNPHSVNPYFTLHKEGWGSGWAAGNVLRFNTIGALAPIWFARTTKPGPEVTPTDHFRIQVRGDAE